MENQFSGRDYFDYEDAPIEGIRGLEIEHRTQQLHGAANTFPAKQYTAQNSHFHSGASSASVYSHSSSGSPTKDTFRLLTREILNNPLLKSVKNTGKPVLTLEPDKFNPMRSMEVPIVYDKYVDISIFVAWGGGSEVNILLATLHTTVRVIPASLREDAN